MLSEELRTRVTAFKCLPCERKEIVSFIETWHYSKNVNGLKTSYCFKLLNESGDLIGAMIYGKIGMGGVWNKYAENENDLLELKRLCCIDDTPKNTESFFIGSTLRWLKKNTSVKTILSYADTTYNHAGTIYKASNFKNIGLTKPGKVIMFQGRRYHDKAIRTKNNGSYKPYAVKLREALASGEATYSKTFGKHIYIYNLRK